MSSLQLAFLTLGRLQGDGWSPWWGSGGAAFVLEQELS